MVGLAWGGMNEAGLMVSTLQLVGTIAPAVDDRPALGNAFWVQYQLDTSATVEDFSGATAVRMLDIHAPLAGDISKALPRYSHRASLARSVDAFQALAPSIPRETIAAHLRDFERFPRASAAAGGSVHSRPSP